MRRKYLDSNELREHPLSKKIFNELPYEEYEALKKDIAGRGIQVPIEITAEYVILTGHERAKIAKELGVKVPCTVRDDLDTPDKQEEHLIKDNLLRRQLTDAERVKAGLRLEEICKERAKQRQQATQLDGKDREGKPKFKSSAVQNFAAPKEKGKTRNLAAKEVNLSGWQYEKGKKILQEADPDTKQEWEKGELSTHQAYLRVRQAEKRKEIEERIKNNFSLPPECKIIHGDALEEVKKIPDGSIDLILTDPPYNVSYENTYDPGDRKPLTKDLAEWDKISDEEILSLLKQWSVEFYRLLGDGGSCYVFVPDKYISHLRDALTKAGFSYKTTITWHKTDPAPSISHANYCHSCEYIAFAVKGRNHAFNWLGQEKMHNFVEGPACRGAERLDHPTQKPVWLLKRFIEVSSVKGDVVLDPFAGVLSTGVACKELERRFILIEKEEYYVKQGKARFA